MPSNTRDSERVERLSEAIEALHTASTTPARQRKQPISPAVDEICTHAYEHGLDRVSLEALVEIVTRKSELDQTSVTTLIKNLYPTGKVPHDAVLTVVGGLGQGRHKPSSATQNALLRWLVNVLEVMQDASVLSKLYSVLFGLLDMITIRSNVCHLLCLITRRKHVRPHRIKQLLELSRMSGNDPALLSLLRIYKDYYPDIIIGTATYGRTPAAAHPDLEWRKRLQVIQDSSSVTSETSSDQTNGFKVLRQGAKRSKVSIIPDVHTSHATESSVTLEEIDSVADFVDRLERIELPNQLVSSLKDPLLQKYLMLNPSNIASKRLGEWLSRYLEEELDSVSRGLGVSSHLAYTLEGIRSQLQNDETLSPLIQSFLPRFVQIWDGVSVVEPLLRLIAQLPFDSFEAINATYLSHVEKALLSRHTEPYMHLMHLYTDLVRNLIKRLSTTDNEVGVQTRSLLQRSLTALNDHVSVVTTTYLALTSPTTQTTSAILDFYEVLSAAAAASSASSQPPSVPILLPQPLTVYHMCLSASLSSTSRLCAILGRYKQAFDSLKAPISEQYGPAVTGRFNGYLMDLCNLFWRTRAFSKTDRNAMGCLCPDATVAALQTYLTALPGEPSLQALFGLSHNQTLAALSAAAMAELEERVAATNPKAPRHRGPVTQRSLAALVKDGGADVPWRQYRVEVLDWLERRGVSGIKELMYATMTGLRDGQQRVSPAVAASGGGGGGGGGGSGSSSAAGGTR